jgi:hypothetical protein
LRDNPSHFHRNWRNHRSAESLQRTKKIATALIFEVAVSREAAERRLIDDLLALFGGRSRPIMAHLVESGNLTLEMYVGRRKLYETSRRGERRNERGVLAGASQSSVPIDIVCLGRGITDASVTKESCAGAPLGLAVSFVQVSHAPFHAHRAGR